MSAIKSKNTGPELFLRKLLFSRGYRYRICPAAIPGHPDIWLRKYNTAVFVHGCFWHRHQGCKFAYMPKTRVAFWNKKFEQNVRRDQTVKKELEESGRRYLIVWECSIKRAGTKTGSINSLLGKIEAFLHGDEAGAEI